MCQADTPVRAQPYQYIRTTLGDSGLAQKEVILSGPERCMRTPKLWPLGVCHGPCKRHPFCMWLVLQIILGPLDLTGLTRLTPPRTSLGEDRAATGMQTAGSITQLQRSPGVPGPR